MLNIGSKISEGVQNVRQRVSGRTRNDGRGAYSNDLSNAPEGIDTPEVNLIDKRFVNPEQDKAASLLQAQIKKRPASQKK